MPAAYTLVDLSEVDPKVRAQLVDDANAGGGLYGLKVVEEYVNGPIRAPIFGYYRDGPDEELWTKAKKEFKLAAADVPDGEIAPAVEVDEAGKEAALRDAAASTAQDLADRARQGDDAAVEAIVGTGEVEGVSPPPPDPASRPTKRTNKAPK